MKDLRAILFTFPLVLVLVFFVQGCVTVSPTIGGSRQLIAVTISPTSGTAPAPSGDIQFVATGHYNTEPYTVTPLTANWGVQTSPQVTATTDQTGLATCKQGSGTTIIEAWVMVPQKPGVMECQVVDSAGNPVCLSVWGAAQLTCP